MHQIARAPPEGRRACGSVRVEPYSVQPWNALLELRLESLRACADARELDGPALRTLFRKLRRVPAVVAVQSPVRVQCQRDVATPAAASASARATVDRARDAPPIEQENRSPSTLLYHRKLGEQRCRERISSLAPQVDNAHGRERCADPRRQLEAIEPRPALDARRGAPVDGDGALERCPLRSESARVVSRIRFLLERGVVLLVDDDQPEVVDGREDR